ncbi:MAG: histidinol dehydrogenase [Phycisphaerales bacterium]
MNGTDAALLRRVGEDEVRGGRRSAIDADTLAGASEIVERVRREGGAGVRAYAERFGERAPGEALVLGRAAMRAALEALDGCIRAVLERTGDRIRAFALAQRSAIRDVDVPIPGGRAGHTVEPIAAVGCYAPAGRYPLPSSVLMTAVTARASGCERVVVASPGAHPAMVAAAAIADADEFLAVGGAHGVAALAYGFDGFDPVDFVVGPGNRWVTAAKHLVSGAVGIDMLAGPSELLVVADESADAALVAADLLAQAEHDTDAVPMLITICPRLVEGVERELARQLATLTTAPTARRALANGFACVVGSLDRAIELADRVAPEHTEIMTRDPSETAALRHAGRSSSARTRRRCSATTAAALATTRCPPAEGRRGSAPGLSVALLHVRDEDADRRPGRRIELDR